MSKLEPTVDKVHLAVAWPYANGDLHLGHLAGSLLPATIFNDYLRLRGTDVIMVSGSDMHGTPVAVKAWKEGMEPHEYAQSIHLKHVEVIEQLGMEFSLYIHTATKLHQDVTQGLFKKLVANGFISKQQTELFWSEKEHKFLLDRYVEGECPYCHFAKARGDQCDNCGRTLTPEELINPYSIFGDTELKKKKSTNYYLDLDKLQPLLSSYFEDTNFNFKNWRKHVASTTMAWLKEGLQSRAITRDMDGYGVQIPAGYEIEGEEGKVIYVWFEAVTGYLSATIDLAVRNKKVEGELSADQLQAIAELIDINLSELESDNSARIINKQYSGQSLNWLDYLTTEMGDAKSDDASVGTQARAKSYYFIGKDNIPFHTIIWPAMLAGVNNDGKSKLKLNLPFDVPANQYLNLQGGKFSKSTGNFIKALEFLQKYGDTSARFYLISRMPETKDTDFTWEEFVEVNNNELVANLGNFIHRTLSFWNKQFTSDTNFGDIQIEQSISAQVEACFSEVAELLNNCKFSEGLSRVLLLSNFANKYFNDTEIWHVIKTDREAATKIMVNLIYLVANLGLLSRPFLPQLSAGVMAYLEKGLGEMDLSPEVGKDVWKPVVVNTARIGEIAELKPLVNKLDLTEVLSAEGVLNAA